MTVTRIVPLSLAKVVGTVYAMLGLIGGAIFSLIALAGGFAANSSSVGGFAAIAGVGAIIAFPILYGCIGFVGMLIIGALFNLAAGMVGGVEVDVK